MTPSSRGAMIHTPGSSSPERRAARTIAVVVFFATAVSVAVLGTTTLVRRPAEVTS